MLELMWIGIMSAINCPTPYRDYVKEDVDAIFAAIQLNIHAFAHQQGANAVVTTKQKRRMTHFL